MDDENAPANQIVFEILESISKYTKEDFLCKEIRKSFHDFVRADGDLSEQILRFLLSKLVFLSHFFSSFFL